MEAEPTTVTFFRVAEIIVAALAGAILLLGSSGMNDYFLGKMWVNEVGTTVFAAGESVAEDEYLFYQLYSPVLPVEDLKTSIERSYVRVGDSTYVFPSPRGFVRFEPGDSGYLEIFKEGGDLVIADRSVSRALTPLKLSCPRGSTKTGTVMIDPGHGYPAHEEDRLGVTEGIARKALAEELGWDKGFVVGSSYESEIVRQIAAVLPYDTTRSKTQDDDITMRQRINKVTGVDTVISLHVGKEIPSKNTIKVFINANADDLWKSEKLGCMLANAFTDELGWDATGSSVVQVNLENLDDDDPKQVLQAPVSAYIELGNAYSPKNIIIANTANTASIIKKVLEEYGK